MKYKIKEKTVELVSNFVSEKNLKETIRRLECCMEQNEDWCGFNFEFKKLGKRYAIVAFTLNDFEAVKDDD